MTEPTNESEHILDILRGEPHRLGEVLERHQERLTRIVRLRLDRRLQGRVDPTDVVQEAFLEAASRLESYSRAPRVPWFIWLRFLTLQQLALAHRQHLGVQARDVGRQISLHEGPMPQASSAFLAAQLVGKLTSPSEAAIRAERKLHLERALNEMEEIDREVLMLRHFEQLSNAEAARVLGIKPAAAGNRYVRALERLRRIISPQGQGESIR